MKSRHFFKPGQGIWEKSSRMLITFFRPEDLVYAGIYFVTLVRRWNFGVFQLQIFCLPCTGLFTVFSLFSMKIFLSLENFHSKTIGDVNIMYVNLLIVFVFMDASKREWSFSPDASKISLDRPYLILLKIASFLF